MFPDESEVLIVTARIRVPCREFSWSVARSSGPGGQNVNKVNSKAIMRWNPVNSTALPEDVRHRFVTTFRSRLTGEGDLILSSERYRDQPRNVDDCLEKLKQLLFSISVAPKPRRAVKPSKAANQRRINAKRDRTLTKSRRRPPAHDGS